MKLISTKVISHFTIADLIGCILPNLTYKKGFGVFLFKSFPYSTNEIFWQFIRHIQPEPHYPSSGPIPYDTVIPFIYKINITFIILIYIWQIIYIPPAFVFFGIIFERIPVIIIRGGAVIRSNRVILPFFIEVYTVSSCMVKDSIKHDSDISFFRFSNQFIKVRQCAKHTVYLHIITGIIPVRAGSFKNRVQINQANTKPCDIVKFTCNSFQIPAKKSPLNNSAFCCLLYTSPSPRDGLLSRMPS